MIKSKLKKGPFILAAGILALTICTGVFTGCQKDTNPLDSKLDNTAIADAAISVANSIAVDEGGALNQVADILDISTSEGLIPDPDILRARFAGKGITTSEKTYDEATGWWTVNLTRKRGEAGSLPYTEILRSYKYQFLTKDGKFQKTWIVDNGAGGVDTAYTIHHKILSGSGINKTPRGSHNLLSLSGEWLVTGVNTETVTINTYNGGSYIKTGADTITTKNAVRTLNHTLTLNFNNVTGPRGRKLNLAEKTSGTITGTYHAVITFQKGGLYSDKTIDKEINITLGGGNGSSFFDIGGMRFFWNKQTGELLP